MSVRLLLCLGALGLVGCAENAILELQFELPAAPPDDGTGNPWFAHVQVRPGSDTFEVPWSGGDEQAIELGSARQWDCLSVESFDPDLDVKARVRFCRSANCLDLADGTRRERWFRLEQPFYIGRRTYWSTQIEEIPECATDGDCGGIGVCTGGVCGCAISSECPASMTCVAGNCVHEVGRCQIEGCIEGDSTTYCSGGDGPHFCETNANADRDGSFNCDLPGG